jgi:glycosyltransferase involved in cell wall biosynthesis
VFRNALFVRRYRTQGILHITGDVHYAALLRPLSRTIITIHDCVVLQRGSGLKRRVLWLLWFWLPLRLASEITVISEQTKREVMETMSIREDRISVIPNFVDSRFAFSERPFVSRQPRILHVGTTPNKNLSNVIAALQGVPCVLTIVGPLSGLILEELKQNGVAYESFIGVDSNVMVRLYQDADIVSFPSLYEGFGMPILEGQAVGRPVLTSDREPMRSVAGRNGALFVNPDSIEAIRAGFRTLIKDEHLRARLVSAGRENCGQYSLDAVAASYRALYRRLDSL